MFSITKTSWGRSCCATLGWGLCGALLIGVPMLITGTYFAVITAFVHGHAIAWSTVLLRSLVLGSIGGCVFGVAARWLDGQNPFAETKTDAAKEIVPPPEPWSATAPSPLLLRRALWRTRRTSRTV
jgi:hypothetical protein